MLARTAAFVLVLGFAAAPAASAAPVIPLASLGDEDDGPSLADGAIVYGRRKGSTFRVLSRPQAGGAPTELTRATGRIFDLSAETGGGVVFESVRGDSTRTFAGPVTGPLASVPAPDLTGLDAISATVASAAGRLVREKPEGESEKTRLRLFATDGTSRLVPLPADFDLDSLEVAGGLIASTTTKRDRLLVVDLRTGAVVRDLATGTPDPKATLDFALGTDGTVALERAGEDSLSLLLAGPTDPEFVPVLPDVVPGPIAVDGTRIAMTAASFRPVPARRTVVIDASDPTRILSRGPLAERISSLSIAGDTVAYELPGCAVAGPATGGTAAVAVPAGPCVRTQISSAGFPDIQRRKGRTEVQQTVKCLAAPGRRCRVRVTASIDPPVLSDRAAKRIGTRTLTIRQGRSSTVRIRARGRATIRTVRKQSSRVRMTGRVTDPGGRSRTESLG